MPYSKNLIAHRGTDNTMLFQFVNQDQKRVDLSSPTNPPAVVTAGGFIIGNAYKIETLGTTDFKLIGSINNLIGQTFTATGAGIGTGIAATIVYKEFTCRLISHDGDMLLLAKQLVMVNALAGQTKLVLTEQELDLISPGMVEWSVEQTLDGALYEPVYIDEHAGGRGVMDITDSIMPAFINSEILTIPDQPGPTFTSSILTTNATDLHTFQFSMAQYLGDITIEGAADLDNNWYTIKTDVIATSDLHSMTVHGFHPYIRITFVETSGSIIEIKYR